ncbi:unnamed protein product [Haemonchus placei]|uniref:NAGPA domain-containing protein n=1 Tax=Haemonchus placei TaxID=6290 RepID=A0A0N4WA47_HAEPC|nr:unnamed protein product [Haemonchus placei]
MLAKFGNVSGKTGLRLNLMKIKYKVVFMNNGFGINASFTPNEKNISEESKYLYLGGEGNDRNQSYGAPAILRDIVMTIGPRL